MKTKIHFYLNFSSIGDNEKDPFGYVYVNMDLFQDSSHKFEVLYFLFLYVKKYIFFFK
jgi:hypothetical protein